MDNDPYKSREAAKYENPIPSREFIAAHIEKRSAPATFKELCNELKMFTDDHTFALKKRLRAMERDGQLIFNKFKRYALVDVSELIKGKVLGHREGFGFLQLEDGERDLFIPSGEMLKVMHGDEVLAKAEGTDKKGRREARIVRVTKARTEPLVGRFFVEHGLAGIVPDDKRITQEVFIAAENRQGARNGQMVVVELLQSPSRRSNPVGKVIEVLGEQHAPGMEIEIALRSHDLPHVWTKAVEDEIAGLTSEVPEQAKLNRVDLRDLPLVTIDGEDARDFDDAVYCEPKKSGGWRLWVAIADVSSYVNVGTALDKEAVDRGNSVYFPAQVIPMLPEVLSNGLCSLNPNVDRLCLVCEMTISAAGMLTGHKFYDAVMRSHQRFTYTQVGEMLDGDEEQCEKFASQMPHIRHLHDLYNALKAKRRVRGAIEFESEETKFIFNTQRKIEAIVPLVRNDAHKLIEECMILANVSAAKFLLKNQGNALYRIHDKPKAEKLQNFRSYLAELGIESTLHDEAEPREYAELLNRIAERPDHELIQVMLLRSMNQAVYDNENIGHFGLALGEYAHFTSPIRRYPDLVVHRAIKAILLQQKVIGKDTGAHAYEVDQVASLGEHCSMTERRADDATRDVSDWLKCEYMQDHVGDVFEGIISSVTNFGFFVRLNDLHIDGLVHITSLRSDYYRFDDKHVRLVGEHSSRVFKLGDVVSVKVVAVHLDDRKIDFVLEEDAAQGVGAPQRKRRTSGAAGRDKPRKASEKKQKGHRGQKGSENQKAAEHRAKKAAKKKKISPSKPKKRSKK